MIIEHADCHQPQADTNHYQELIPGVTSNGSSEAAQPNGEDPYHVSADEISAIEMYGILLVVLYDHIIY